MENRLAEMELGVVGVDPQALGSGVQGRPPKRWGTLSRPPLDVDETFLLARMSG